MYLVEIDSMNGLVKVDKQYDGIMAIPEFRAIINNKDFGLECFTAIALVADWLSPIRYYSFMDRPKRAMYDVTQKRDKWNWLDDRIQAALIKYKELQYNPDLVEKDNLDNLLRDKLETIKKEKDSDKLIDLFKQLNTIKDLLKAWNKDNEDKDFYSGGPVVNGYLISRLEEKLNDRNSFYNN